MGLVLANWFNKIAGEYPVYSINERAARITCAFTSLNFFIGFIAAAFLGMGFYYAVFQLIFSLPFFILFYLLVRKKYVNQVILLLVLILSASFIVGWFYAGGLNGPFIAGGLVIFYVALNVSLVKNRLYVSIYMISIIAITLFLNYMHPNWVQNYPQDTGRYIDYMLTVVQLSIYFIFVEASNRHCYHFEQQLVNQRNLELQQSNDAKLKLFAIISHDLRGPMATLKGILKSVEEGFSTPEKAQRQLVHLKTMTTPLNNTLDNLLLWSRGHLEGLNASPELFRVGEILNEEILLAKEDADARNVTIHNNIAPEVVVFADINQLRIIFRNLISNAIRYANSGTLVELADKSTNEKVVFSVSNTGMAIPVQVAEHFNLTGRVEGKGVSPKHTGLGLQLCYDFIRLNGGEIWIDTASVSKTVFCISSPKAIS